MSPRVIVHLVCLFRLDLVQARVLCSVLDVINAFIHWERATGADDDDDYEDECVAETWRDGGVLSEADA